MKESFVFYSSFYKAIKDLDDKKRLKMYDAITKFALENEKIVGLNGICEQLFYLIEPQIVANNKRYEVGCKGGRPKKIKTDGFQKTKTDGYENKKPNENVNENVNENDNVNENVVSFSQRTQSDKNFISFGEYGNVYLTQMQRNKVDTMTMNKEASQELIDELSRNIASNKEPVFNENYPDMHIARLQAYWSYKRKQNRSAPQQEDYYDLIAEVQKEVEDANKEN